MICTLIRGKLSGLMDNVLDGDESMLVRRHLEDCPDCREYLEGLRKADALVQGLSSIDPSPTFTARLMSAAISKPVVAGQEAFSFWSHLTRLVMWAPEALFNLFALSGRANTRTLDEFSDCPPLSMGFIYFRLLDRAE